MAVTPVAPELAEQTIKQGGCTPEQLANGWFEAGGNCYGPTAGGGGHTCPACESGYLGCDARCEKRTGAAAERCHAACWRALSLCESRC